MANGPGEAVLESLCYQQLENLQFSKSWEEDERVTELRGGERGVGEEKEVKPFQGRQILLSLFEKN